MGIGCLAYIYINDMELKYLNLYGFSLGVGCIASFLLTVQTFFIKALVDYLSLLYVNGAVLFTVELIATFKLQCSKSYNNAKVFRYYLYFMIAILLWMIFN